MSFEITDQELTNVYQCFLPKAITFLQRKYRTQDCDAKDIADQTFMEAFYGNGNRYDPEKAGDKMCWLFRKLDHRAVDFLRCRKRRGKLNEAAASGIGGRPLDPERLYCTKRQEENREKLFNGLPEDLKALWKLLRTHTPIEAARLLQVDVQQVRKGKRRIGRHIKLLIKKQNLRREDLYDR